MNLSSFEKRIATVEGRTRTNPVVLHLADGSTRTIRGDVKHYFALWNAGSAQCSAELAGEPIPASPLDKEIAWIKSAVTINEPAHRFELMRALLVGPNLEGESEETP
jgi:hypothetical protein